MDKVKELVDKYYHLREVYVTSAFSLGMLVDMPATLRVEELTPEEYVAFVKSLEGGHGVQFTIRIGHQSTVQALRKVFGEKLNFPDADRTPVSLRKGDAVVVLQVLKRPAEGQVYSEEEIQEIIEKGLLKILLVAVE